MTSSARARSCALTLASLLIPQPPLRTAMSLLEQLCPQLEGFSIARDQSVCWTQLSTMRLGQESPGTAPHGCSHFPAGHGCWQHESPVYMVCNLSSWSLSALDLEIPMPCSASFLYSGLEFLLRNPRHFSHAVFLGASWAVCVPRLETRE